MKQKRSPDEKKRLSYAKDRRNTFGENSKASRKNIPRSKALSIRSERHAQTTTLRSAVHCTTEDNLVAIESSIRATKPRYWRKEPDTPLGKFLANRADRSGKR